MNYYSTQITNLIDELRRLPGHHGVAADDHSIRVLFCHCKALADGQLLHQLRRSGGSDGALVKIADADREIGGVQGKQLPSAGAAGG